MTRHVVAVVGELPLGGSKRVKAGGRDIALFRNGDEYHAIADRCPHEGASLCAGRVVGLATSSRPGEYRLERRGEMVRCPWHGWEFDLRTGQSWCDPDRVRVRAFGTSVAGGADLANGLAQGPYVAETFPVTVERDYVLVETAAPGWIDAVVSRRTEGARNIAVIELARPDGAALPPFEPGAHIDLQAGPRVVRQYSLCGDPEEHASYRIAVLLEPASRGGSAAIHRALLPGALVQIGHPRSHFHLARHPGRSVLIAGGIGITPLMGMAAALSRAGAPYILHYLARSLAHAAFLDELRSGPVGPQLRFWPTGGGFDIARALRPDADTYACGPSRLMDAVASHYGAFGLTPSRLHVEHFTSDVSHAGPPFRVEAARSGISVTVGEEQSIAEALAEHGIAVDLSCEQGVCGTCLLPVLDGVPDHRDRVQTGAEKTANRQVAACCSRARSDVLVLDV